MSKFSENTIIDFVEYTGFDIYSYLGKWRDFVKIHFNQIINYFTGLTNSLNQDSIDSLQQLRKESEDLQNTLEQYSEDFTTIDYWGLIEYLEEINNKVKQYLVIDRFLRSSKYGGFNEDSLTQSYTMKDFDTLESIANKDRDDSQNSWSDIAIKNSVLEIDYLALRGGKELRLGKRVLNNYYLLSVVDNLQGERVYGLDIDNNFSFENDDIKVLTYRDTFKQSVNVLSDLGKGDLPEFPKLGISKELFVGSNIGDFSFPFISRELENTFASDDTIINFRVEELSRKGSTIFMSYQIESFYNFVYEKSVNIQT